MGIANHTHQQQYNSANWYDQMTAHQMQYGYPLPYNGQYQTMYGHSLPGMTYPHPYGSPSPGAYYNNGGYSWENYYCNQGRPLQGQSENQVSAKKPKNKV